MSAYLVDAKTISRAVDVILAKRTTFGGIPCAHVDCRRADADGTAIGRALWAMNAAAVAGRYHGPVECPEFVYSYNGTFDLQHRRIVAMVQGYKTIQCLEYQCAEDATINNPLYLALGELRNELARDIVNELPDYQAAAWG